MQNTLSVYDLIGKGYEDIWFTNCDARYRLLKGARNTKKSYDFIGLEPIFKILTDERRNIVMCRQNDKDNRDSTFANLKSKIRKLGLWHDFVCLTNPMKIIYKRTGQVILFRGLNDIESITSITVETGYLTDIYIEEGSQMKSYDDFRVLDGSLRGDLPSGLHLQITILFNAWDIESWLYDKFFKGYLEDDLVELEDKGFQFAYYPTFNLGYGFGLALHISSYLINEFRAPYYDESMNILKKNAYEIWKVEGMGCWGNTMDKTYSCWNKDLVKSPQVVNNMQFACLTIGIDVGLSNGEGHVYKGEKEADKIRSATTMVLCGMSSDYTKIIALDEFFHSNVGLSEDKKISTPKQQEIMCDLIKKWMDMYNMPYDTCVYVDCADIGFRDGISLVAKNKGLYGLRFIGSTKFKIQTRVDFTDRMMAFGNIVISEKCSNLIREINSARKSKDGKCREDTNDHTINAWEYAWSPYAPRLKMWGDFKPR